MKGNAKKSGCPYKEQRRTKKLDKEREVSCCESCPRPDKQITKRMCCDGCCDTVDDKTVSLESISLEEPTSGMYIKTKTKSDNVLHNYVTKKVIKCRKCDEGPKKYMSQHQNTVHKCKKKKKGDQQATNKKKKQNETTKYKDLYEDKPEVIREKYFRIFKGVNESESSMKPTKTFTVETCSCKNSRNTPDSYENNTVLQKPRKTKMYIVCDDNTCGTNCGCAGNCRGASAAPEDVVAIPKQRLESDESHFGTRCFKNGDTCEGFDNMTKNRHECTCQNNQLCNKDKTANIDQRRYTKSQRFKNAADNPGNGNIPEDETVLGKNTKTQKKNHEVHDCSHRRYHDHDYDDLDEDQSRPCNGHNQENKEVPCFQKKRSNGIPNMPSEVVRSKHEHERIIASYDYQRNENIKSRHHNVYIHENCVNNRTHERQDIPSDWIRSKEGEDDCYKLMENEYERKEGTKSRPHKGNNCMNGVTRFQRQCSIEREDVVQSRYHGNNDCLNKMENPKKQYQNERKFTGKDSSTYDDKHYDDHCSIVTTRLQKQCNKKDLQSKRLSNDNEICTKRLQRQCTTSNNPDDTDNEDQRQCRAGNYGENDELSSRILHRHCRIIGNKNKPDAIDYDDIDCRIREYFENRDKTNHKSLTDHEKVNYIRRKHQHDECDVYKVKESKTYSVINKANECEKDVTSRRCNHRNEATTINGKSYRDSVPRKCDLEAQEMDDSSESDDSSKTQDCFAAIDDTDENPDDTNKAHELKNSRKTSKYNLNNTNNKSKWKEILNETMNKDRTRNNYDKDDQSECNDSQEDSDDDHNSDPSQNDFIEDDEVEDECGNMGKDVDVCITVDEIYETMDEDELLDELDQGCDKIEVIKQFSAREMPKFENESMTNTSNELVSLCGVHDSVKYDHPSCLESDDVDKYFTNNKVCTNVNHFLQRNPFNSCQPTDSENKLIDYCIFCNSNVRERISMLKNLCKKIKNQPPKKDQPCSFMSIKKHTSEITLCREETKKKGLCLNKISDHCSKRRLIPELPVVQEKNENQSNDTNSYTNENSNKKNSNTCSPYADSYALRQQKMRPVYSMWSKPKLK